MNNFYCKRQYINKTECNWKLELNKLATGYRINTSQMLVRGCVEVVVSLPLHTFRHSRQGIRKSLQTDITRTRASQSGCKLLLMDCSWFDFDIYQLLPSANLSQKGGPSNIMKKWIVNPLNESWLGPTYNQAVTNIFKYCIDFFKKRLYILFVFFLFFLF